MLIVECVIISIYKFTIERITVATKTKKSIKKAVTTKSKVIASSKKHILNKKQWGIVVGISVLLLGIGTYFGIQQYQNTTADAASCISKTYRQGSSGNCVKYIQQLVNYAIDYAKRPGASNASDHNRALSKLAKLKVDGAYGAKTKAAVTAYQKNAKITKSTSQARVSLNSNGIVDSKTWGALCLPYASKSPARSAGCSGTPYKNVAFY